MKGKLSTPLSRKEMLTAVKNDPYFALKYKRWSSEKKINLMGAALIRINEDLEGAKKVDPTKKDIGSKAAPLLIDGETRQMAFQLACQYGQKNLALELLDRKDVNPNQPSLKSVLPLQAALYSAQNGNFEFALNLIGSKKFDLTTEVAQVVAEVGATEVLEILAKEKIPFDEATSLQKALENRQEGTARFLLSKMDTKELEAMTIGGLSLIQYAVVYSPPGLREALNERGVFFRYTQGMTERLEKALKDIFAADLKLLRDKGLVNITELNQLIAELEGEEPKEPSELCAKLMLGIEFYLKQSALEDAYKAKGKHVKHSEWMPVPFGDYFQLRRGYTAFGDPDFIRHNLLKLLKNICQMGKKFLDTEKDLLTASEFVFFEGINFAETQQRQEPLYRGQVEDEARDLKYL